MQADEIRHRQIVLVGKWKGRVHEPSSEKPGCDGAGPHRPPRWPERGGRRRESDVKRWQHRQQITFQRRAAEQRHQQRLRQRGNAGHSPLPRGEHARPAHRDPQSDRADPTKIGDKQIVESPQQGGGDTNRVQRIRQVVTCISAIPE